VATIIELLVKIQIIDERQHDAVMSRSRSTAGGHVVQQIAEMGYATEGTVARAISVELGLPRIELAMTPPEPAALALLDARTCADRFLLPVALRENGELLWLAMADPTDQEALGVVRRKTQKRVRPAVAGPTEILRSVRTLYAAPSAGKVKAEGVTDEKLAAIEIANAESESQGEAFEVMNVADDIENSPISRLAKQLGVAVPAHMPSHRDTPLVVPRRDTPIAVPRRDTPIAVPRRDTPVVGPRRDTPLLVPRHRPASSGMPVPAVPTKGPSIPPKTDPRMRQPPPSAPPAPLTFDELFAAGPGGRIDGDDLTDEDVSTLDALRGSMEKGALVLRSLAELCLEKGVFTREEMKRRNQKS
jgi:type IV pilus assembly protein PilB